MGNEFIDDGFLKFARPGYNVHEQKWHFNRFQSQQDRIAAIADLSIEVSKGLNIPRTEAMKLILSAMPDGTSEVSPQESREAMAQLADWVVKLGEIANDVQLSKNQQGRDITTMICVSRLPLQWVLDNQDQLEVQYFIDLPPNKADLEDGSPLLKDAVDYARLGKLKRAKWLKSKGLWEVMEALVSMLPGSVIEEIVEYALNEYRDGKPAEATEPETPEEQLGKPGLEPPMPDEPANS